MLKILKLIIAASLAFSFLASPLQGKDYKVAFYSDFEPISYSVDKNPASSKFDTARGFASSNGIYSRIRYESSFSWSEDMG